VSYDVRALRAGQFPITGGVAYLDNGTFGPPPRAFVEAVGAVLREAGVIAAVRDGRLRLSLHGYDDESDVERLLAALPG
jgi:hypothetical protein